MLLLSKNHQIAAHASKNKAQNGKALPSNGGSLANMSGPASAKPKPPITTNSTAVASVAVELLYEDLQDQEFEVLGDQQPPLHEVTEVVWEGEPSASDKADKNVATAAASRAALPSKPQPVSNTDKSKASSKTAGNKKPAAKAGTKQRSIMSFFKKV